MQVYFFCVHYPDWLKASFTHFLKAMFVVTPSGWSKWIIFFVTITDSTPTFDNITLVSLLIGPWMHPTPKSFFWGSGKAFSSVTFLMYGTKTSLIKWIAYVSLLQSFPLKAKQNLAENWHLRKIFLFSRYIRVVFFILSNHSNVVCCDKYG